MQNLEEIIPLKVNPRINDSSNIETELIHDIPEEKEDARIDEAIVELAINETGFGKFSIKVTIICFLIYLNISLCTTYTGFILPSAACDLKMSTVEKGLLSTSFFIGSCFSSVISGFLANLKGRKWILTISLFMQGISDLLQAIVPNYSTIMGLKFISGFAASGQLMTIFTYLSECLPIKQRKFLLSFMEFFWICGHGVASILGFFIIPLEFEMNWQYFYFRSWNLYILICSLLGIFLGFWIITFPETPKYLAEMGRRDEFLKVLVKMYGENLGKSKKEYVETLMKSGNSFLMKVASHEQNKFVALNKNSVTGNFLLELKQIGSVLKAPYFKNTFLACITGFCVPAGYYALYLWLPEIFQRFADFEAKNKNEKPNFCKVSREIHSSLTDGIHEIPPVCDRTIDTEVFINNLLLCASCIPAIFPVLCLVHRFGFKFLLGGMCLICSAVVVGIYFVNSSLQNLILLCIYLPLISVCITLTFALFVTIFPTNLRSSGVTLTTFSSRIGSAFGNIIFSYLINEYCLQFIILVALLLVVSAVTTMLIHER
ncbi:synaptic vesicle glycoprotein 2B-like [Leptopilina heterotoma]|uniref:synaptic vesicle glycoprotein 2B-like n=1 Tax=Leptopilina heterotoma TaxID=63436 RepID=UPI001CAA1ACC|nr:synaptic vesicle glycoprotein 2B-like [Leptopilina heterotoma]